MAKLSKDRHNEAGEEILDPTPMQPPLGYKRTLSLSEQIAQQVRIAHLKILRDNLADVAESEEEADDFEVGDDFEPMSQYENDHMPTLGKLKKKAAEIQAAIRKRQTELAIEAHEKSIKKTQAVTSPPAQPADNSLKSE